MGTISYNQVISLMAASSFLMGMVTFMLGVFVMVFRAMGRDMRNLSTQTKTLAQKGIAENISGLVGNASVLLNAMQSLVKTAAGIGIFLTIVGLSLLATSYWLFTQVTWPL